MEPAGKSGNLPPRFRRIFFRGVALLAAAPVLFFLLSNLWLATPWGRGWIAEKISSRLGMEAHLEGVNWSPWSGIRLRGLTVLQPPPLRAHVSEPLFAATDIRLWPVWKAWARRRLELHSVEIERPRVVVPLQLLSHLSPSPAAPAPVPAIAAIKVPVVPAPLASGNPPAFSVPIIPLEQPVTAPSSPAVVQEVPAPPKSAPQVPPPAGTTAPTNWVHIRDGSFAFVSAASDQPSLEARGLHADLPLGGASANSSARLETLSLFGNPLTSDLRLPLQWQLPILAIGPSEQSIAGITFAGGAKVGLVNGLPTHVQIECPIQKDLAWDWANHTGARLGNLRAGARFSGFLVSPASWQGDLGIEGQTLSVNRPDTSRTFDRGNLVAGLRGNVVAAPDFRMIGDNLSLLGNALAFTDGRGAAVLRIVAEPTIAAGISSKFAAIGAPLNFAPLGTPDRMAVDLTLYTYPDGSILLQLGAGGPALDKDNALKLIKALMNASP